MVIFSCKQELEAMLTCIYEAWASGRGHRNIRLEIEPIGQYSILDEYIHVDGDYKKAESVMRAVLEKISPTFYKEVLGSLGYYEADTLDNAYRMLLLGFKFGISTLNMMNYEVVARNMKIRKAYSREVYRFQEIARFNSLKNGMLVSHIEPRSDILENLEPIFTDRMPSENWMIIDDNRAKTVIHPAGKHSYLRWLNEMEMESLRRSEEENDHYTDLWKLFFNSIAIKERTNHECQMNLFPLWARKHATEFQ